MKQNARYLKSLLCLQNSKAGIMQNIKTILLYFSLSSNTNFCFYFLNWIYKNRYTLNLPHSFPWNGCLIYQLLRILQIHILEYGWFNFSSSKTKINSDLVHRNVARLNKVNYGSNPILNYLKVPSSKFWSIFTAHYILLLKQKTYLEMVLTLLVNMH